MRAALLTKPRTLELVEDWPEPELAAGMVIVQVTGVGICGSDLALWSGGRQPRAYPWLIGHEAIGRVLQLGAAVTEHSVGDRVVIEPNYPCGRCEACQAGRTSTCPHRLIVAVNSAGFLCERIAVPARFAWPAPTGVSDADLVCTEPLAVARNAVRISGITRGARCLVIGAGAQGLLVCQLALAMGARVDVVEPNPGRLELATSIGCTAVNSSSATYPAAIETSGVEAGIRTAISRVAPGGNVVLVGIPNADVSISIAAIVRNQVSVVGSLIYDHPGDFAETLDLIARRAVVPSEILRPPAEFSAIGDVMADAASLVGKSWITFDGTA